MLRRRWVSAVTREFQVLVGHFLDMPPAARRPALEALLARLPPPRGPVETQLLQGWALRAERECRAAAPPRSPDIPARARAYVELHLAETLPLRKVARAVKCQPQTLARVFRKAHGVTLRRYIEDRRFSAARVLLAEEVKVEAAARIVGFGSRKALYRLIRVKAGVTPRGLSCPAFQG